MSTNEFDSALSGLPNTGNSRMGDFCPDLFDQFSTSLFDEQPSRTTEGTLRSEERNPVDSAVEREPVPLSTASTSMAVSILVPDAPPQQPSGTPGRPPVAPRAQKTVDLSNVRTPNAQRQQVPVQQQQPAAVMDRSFSFADANGAVNPLNGPLASFLEAKLAASPKEVQQYHGSIQYPALIQSIRKYPLQIVSGAQVLSLAGGCDDSAAEVQSHLNSVPIARVVCPGDGGASALNSTAASPSRMASPSAAREAAERKATCDEYMLRLRRCRIPGRDLGLWAFSNGMKKGKKKEETDDQLLARIVAVAVKRGTPYDELEKELVLNSAVAPVEPSAPADPLSRVRERSNSPMFGIETTTLEKQRPRREDTSPLARAANPPPPAPAAASVPAARIGPIQDRISATTFSVAKVRGRNDNKPRALQAVEVELIIDTREKEPIKDVLRESRDVKTHIDTLTAGDFGFRLRWINGPNPSAWWWLPLLIERKRDDDMNQSVKGDRYVEQKDHQQRMIWAYDMIVGARAAEQGVPRSALTMASGEFVGSLQVYWVLEQYGGRLDPSERKRIDSASSTIAQVEGFGAIRTENIHATATMLKNMHADLHRRWSHATNEQLSVLVPYDDFNKELQHQRVQYKVAQTYPRMLANLRGCAEWLAFLIQRTFPTMLILRASLQEHGVRGIAIQLTQAGPGGEEETPEETAAAAPRPKPSRARAGRDSETAERDGVFDSNARLTGWDRRRFNAMWEVLKTLHRLLLDQHY